MTQRSLLGLILLVAAATYLLRVLPLALLRKPLRSPRAVAFIAYLPYAILTAMVLPGIFSSTGDRLSSWTGFAVAMGCSLLGCTLPVVALAATAAAYVCALATL